MLKCNYRGEQQTLHSHITFTFYLKLQKSNKNKSACNGHHRPYIMQGWTDTHLSGVVMWNDSQGKLSACRES